MEGLEPPHLTVLEPKSSASTSSTTPAYCEFVLAVNNRAIFVRTQLGQYNTRYR